MTDADLKQALDYVQADLDYLHELTKVGRGKDPTATRVRYRIQGMVNLLENLTGRVFYSSDFSIKIEEDDES